MTSTIKVCMGSSCFARGNIQNLQLIQNYLKENNLEAEVELVGLRCCDKCSQGPNITIDDVDKMLDLGLMSAPNLGVNDNMFNFNEARKLVDAYDGKTTFEKFVLENM